MKLTSDVQVERSAGSFPFGVAGVAGVTSGRTSCYALQNQTRLADDDTGTHVVLQKIALP